LVSKLLNLSRLVAHSDTIKALILMRDPAEAL